MKRNNYISWDEYFMGIALLSAERSKDPNTQVGACIVKDNKILGVGYNGFPQGCSDDELPWKRDGEYIDTKYPYVVHAELNAILNSNFDLTGATVYVSLYPCVECAKAIIQSGIKRIVFLSNKYENDDLFKASKKLFDLAGVKQDKLDMKNKKIVLNYE